MAPFGCPVYVLDSKLQNNNIFHKWKQKSEVGIYIGTSPIHSKNVALVLSRSTGLVSPQFHVKFDDRFQTINDISNESLWQTKAGFISTQKIPGAASQELLSQNTRALSASEGVNIQDVDLTPTESFTMLQGGNTMAPEGEDSEGVASEGAIPMSPTPEGVNQPGINKRKQPSVLKEHNPKRKTAKTHCKYSKR